MPKKGKKSKKKRGGAPCSSTAANSSSAATATALFHSTAPPSAAPDAAFVLAAGSGCHLAHVDTLGRCAAPWLLAPPEHFEPADFGLPDDYDEASVPDLSLDPESAVLTLINASRTATRCYHVSLLSGHAAFGSGGGGWLGEQVGVAETAGAVVGQRLGQSVFRDEKGRVAP